MRKRLNILGICGSPRVRFSDVKKAIDIIRSVTSYQELYTKVYDFALHKQISNTEALAWLALFGAQQNGADIDLIHLKKEYTTKRKRASNRFREKVSTTDGLLLATPVYFGDYSSTIASFFRDIPTDGKVVGVVSAGAKRNGGQETTNIFSLFEALSMGAHVVGNGPPTSQYGGTGWAGDVGAILDDNFGLSTSMGTGSRVTEIVRQTRADEKRPAEIALLTSHRAGEEELAETLAQRLESVEDLKIRRIHLADYEIQPCKGCSICPSKKTDRRDYGCVISDGMPAVTQQILGLDGIVLVVNNREDSWKTLRLFFERTRFLRRDHFRLSDVPVFVVEKIELHAKGTIPSMPMRIVTFFLRHNTYINGPIARFYFQNEKCIFQTEGLESLSRRIATHAYRHNGARAAGLLNDYTYVPLGYGAEYASHSTS
jgi:multimeric flavodoxin WrbA